MSFRTGRCSGVAATVSNVTINLILVRGGLVTGKIQCARCGSGYQHGPRTLSNTAARSDQLCLDLPCCACDSSQVKHSAALTLSRTAMMTSRACLHSEIDNSSHGTSLHSSYWFHVDPMADPLFWDIAAADFWPVESSRSLVPLVVLQYGVQQHMLFRCCPAAHCSSRPHDDCHWRRRDVTFSRAIT